LKLNARAGCAGAAGDDLLISCAGTPQVSAMVWGFTWQVETFLRLWLLRHRRGKPSLVRLRSKKGLIASRYLSKRLVHYEKVPH
jgi:hypothetical protein